MILTVVEVQRFRHHYPRTAGSKDGGVGDFLPPFRKFHHLQVECGDCSHRMSGFHLALVMSRSATRHKLYVCTAVI